MDPSIPTSKAPRPALMQGGEIRFHLGVGEERGNAAGEKDRVTTLVGTHHAWCHRDCCHSSRFWNIFSWKLLNQWLKRKEGYYLMKWKGQRQVRARVTELLSDVPQGPQCFPSFLSAAFSTSKVPQSLAADWLPQFQASGDNNVKQRKKEDISS